MRGVFISPGEIAMIAYSCVIFCERLLTHMTVRSAVKCYPIVFRKICYGNVNR